MPVVASVSPGAGRRPFRSGGRAGSLPVQHLCTSVAHGVDSAALWTASSTVGVLASARTCPGSLPTAASTRSHAWSC
jgi:hypothetical protein